ncbi:MAG: GxxExxY protein, partial [Anaerolineae bacterium]|nr:GxxExxY protein [Anaerolineae bacterium]
REYSLDTVSNRELLGAMPTHSYKGYDFDDGTYPIIGACLRVHKELGPGFREVIYQRALALELQASGLDFVREEWISVHYRGQVIGKHRVDFIIGSVMIEIKASSTLDREDFVQGVSYLKASSAVGRK